MSVVSTFPIQQTMSGTTDLSNLVENEVFDDNQPAFPPAPQALQRPNTFASSVQSQLPLPSAEGTPLRDTRLKLAQRTEGLRTIILAFGVFSFGLTVALVIELFIGAPSVAPHGGVSSSSELCSNIGIEQLKKGGNAIDAAISVMLCIGVVRPQSGGLGGGGFMIIHDHKTHNSTLLDFRETAPETMAKSALEKESSVGVPGELAGMHKAHQLYGRMAWADLFTPVIKLATDGWNLDDKDREDLQRRAEDLKVDNENYARFRQNIIAAAAQATMRRQDLANLLRQLATTPDEALQLFYSGKLAREIEDTVKKSNGVLTVDDLSNYAVKIREPIVSTFRDFKIITFPSPSSGSLLVHMLNELDSVKTKDDVGTSDYYAKMAKVISKAYTCRALLGDSPNTEEHERLLINATLNIDDQCEGAAAVTMPPDDIGTSHINVIDNNELMVSVTTSLNSWFGSLLMTPSGILLNNQLNDFDTTSKANRVKPGKRPLSSMVPTIVYHEKRACLQRIVIGGTNGTKIPSSVVQTLMNLLVKGDNLATAVETSKLFCDDKKCQLENFPEAEEIANAVQEKTKLPVSIVDEKLSTVGLLVKLNSTVDGYEENSSYGKAVTY